MKKVIFVALLLLMLVPLMAQGDGEGSNLAWIWTALTGVLTVVGALLKNQVDKLKGNLKEVVKLGMESTEALDAAVVLADVTLKAAEDNVFNEQEKADMKAAALNFNTQRSDVKAQWKVLWSGILKKKTV